MKQMTEAQAIALYNSGKWHNWSAKQIVALQLYQNKLCVDFSAFHEAVEEVLGRPVWTHEFARPERLRQEYEGRRPRGTVQESFDILQELMPDKPVIVVTH